MWIALGAVIVIISFIGFLVKLAGTSATRAEKLTALKKEVKEHTRAQKIINDINSMPIDDVRERLRNLPRE